MPRSTSERKVASPHATGNGNDPPRIVADVGELEVRGRGLRIGVWDWREAEDVAVILGGGLGGRGGFDRGRTERRGA